MFWLFSCCLQVIEIAISVQPPNRLTVRLTVRPTEKNMPRFLIFFKIIVAIQKFLLILSLTSMAVVVAAWSLIALNLKTAFANRQL